MHIEFTSSELQLDRVEKILGVFGSFEITESLFVSKEVCLSFGFVILGLVEELSSMLGYSVFDLKILKTN